LLEDLVAGPGHDAQFTVVEIDDLARVREDRRGVARHEILPVANADQQRTALAGGDDLVGVVRRQHGDAVRAFDEVQRVDHGVLQRITFGHGRLDQVGQHLAVGLRLELVALFLEQGPERAVVLDDAVVHDGDLALAVDVRVGVALVGLPVGGPTRMRDPNRPVDRAAVHDALELGDLALGFARLEAVAVHRRDAGRVIAPILQALEPIDEERRRRLRSYVSHNSAHMSFPCCSGLEPINAVRRAAPAIS
jgi:hypothetical protein